jgi:hypothetical protein
MRKIAVVGISILSVFILCSLSYNPIIAVEQIEYEEITVNICGLESQRVNLSKDDGERLDGIFDELRNKLSKVETREETIILYNNVLAELYNLGIFGNIDLKEIQHMMTSNTLFKPYSITGVTTNSMFVPQGYKTLHILDGLIDKIRDLPIKNENILNIVLLIIYICLELTLLYNWLIGIPIVNILPLHFIGVISLGKISYPQWKGNTHYYPASGWITVQDENGTTHNYSDKYYGNLGIMPGFPWGSFYGTAHYIGIKGFIGISIIRDSSLFYMGSASKFAITDKAP